MPTTISRPDLINAVVKGIEAAGVFTTEHVEALRKFARETDRVAIGGFIQDDCYCPLAAVGLFDGSELCGPHDKKSLWRFIHAFDNAASAATCGNTYHPVEVID